MNRTWRDSAECSATALHGGQRALTSPSTLTSISRKCWFRFSQISLPNFKSIKESVLSDKKKEKEKSNSLFSCDILQTI